MCGVRWRARTIRRDLLPGILFRGGQRLAALFLCAEYVRSLGGESPPHNLVMWQAESGRPVPPFRFVVAPDLIATSACGATSLAAISAPHSLVKAHYGRPWEGSWSRPDPRRKRPRGWGECARILRGPSRIACRVPAQPRRTEDHIAERNGTVEWLGIDLITLRRPNRQSFERIGTVELCRARIDATPSGDGGGNHRARCVVHGNNLRGEDAGYPWGRHRKR